MRVGGEALLIEGRCLVEGQSLRGSLSRKSSIVTCPSELASGKEVAKQCGGVVVSG